MEELVNKLDGPVTMPEQVRELRCVEVLEQINSPESRDVLEEFGQKRRKAHGRREAKESPRGIDKVGRPPP